MAAACMVWAVGRSRSQRGVSASEKRGGGVLHLRLALAGAMLLCGPMIGLLLGGRAVNANSVTLALTLVPLAAAVAQSAMGDAAPGSFAGRAWPALAALGGLLLLLPQPTLTDPLSDLALALAPLLTGVGAAMLLHDFAEEVAAQTVAASSHIASSLTATREFAPALAGAALVFGLPLLIHAALRRGEMPAFAWSAVVLDALVAALALMALARLGAARWSARFVVVPLAIVLEGLTLLRPRIDVRTCAAVALMLVAAVFLLLPQADAD
jgi:drug/metabolite transporter (DMT)-like permease